METQNRYPQPQYGLQSSDFEQRQLMRDPNYPSPASLSPSQDTGNSLMTNGAARTTSRRHRPSRVGPEKAQVDHFPQPPIAPEVPNAPPVSYRPPQESNGYKRPALNYPASFAERARILTGRNFSVDDPNVDRNVNADVVAQPPKSQRRASLNRPIGGLYTEIAQQRRDSYPSPASVPTSPRRSSIATSPQSHAIPSAQAPSGVRRASTTAVQPTRKEWAPDRSPLQKLEIKFNDISKEEKRARVEAAERRLRDSRIEAQNEGPTPKQAVNRDSSRRGSASPALIDASRQSDRDVQTRKIPATYTPSGPDIDFSMTRSREQRHRKGADAKAAASQSELQSLEPVQSIATGISPSLSRDRWNQTSKSVNQPPERGVRFQGEEDQDTAGVDPAYLNRRDSRPRGSNTEGDASAANARAARRERLREDTSIVANRSASKEVPSEQLQLYSSRVGSSRNDKSAASYGGELDPISRETVSTVQKTPKYGIPPQTASGIQARQRIGFGSESLGVTDAPAHRRHHFSEILHRGRDHAANPNEQSGSKQRHLDEWKQGGTARLMAADFTTDDSSTDQSSALEDSKSASRRRSRRAKGGAGREARSLPKNNQNSNGKTHPPLSAPGKSPEGSRVSQTAPTPATHTRPYVSQDHGSVARRAVFGKIRSHESLLSSRHKTIQNKIFTSAYSYSCPQLADHDPAHENHICEPYLSKELIKSMRSVRIRPVPAVASFSPPLYLKCGPLLRYTGLRRETLQSKERNGPPNVERETWRGSVMIVTSDVDSTYDPAPILRLFPEPIELLPPPPQNFNRGNDRELPNEYTDPIAGLPKLSRTGKTIYVKPVDDLDDGADLSRIENDEGLFEESRTAAVPTSYGTPDFHHARNGPKIGKTSSQRANGRSAKRGHRVKGVRLHAERGITFWRFNLEVELNSQEARIAYSINNGPSVGFWVPARGHSMNVMFHSCNGFSMSVDPNNFSGPDPLWRDVLNSHQTRPFHVMIGGGDQIYNDAVMSQSKLFREWLEIKTPHHKHEADFTPSMQEELETFYLERYSMWFSQGLFGMANSQIPMVNMWDDHDIIDGFGSYPHNFMSTPVFCGIGAVAYKYYLLFQHQSVPEETSADEPSWLLGAAPGPYINELSRSVFISLGKHIAFLGLDCRTERMREEILSEASYDLVFDRCRREIIQGETKHLIVLLGVPIAYPRLVWLENLLTSRVMNPIKALGRAGMLGGFLNKFDGGVEILDDLDDHWTARNHKQERNWFIQELQELAAEKSVRITILGGDVHLAAIGQFYSNPKLKIPKDRDHRYMANIISSAIVNTPPPEMMGDILNKRNKTHHLDHETDEDMIPMFTHDVDGKARNNKRLLPRRNWCSIREYHPGSTPPPTPPWSETQSPSEEDTPPPPTRLQRTLSLTRGDIKPGNLIRRLSGRGPPSSSEYPISNKYDTGDSPPHSPPGDGYFPHQPVLPRSTTAPTNGDTAQRNSSEPISRPGNFHRRPTNMSQKAASKGDVDDNAGHINLEQGLDVVLYCEVNQRNPAGTTVPYRLLIPALWYEGFGDKNTEPHRKRNLLSRFGSFRGGRRGDRLAIDQDQGSWGKDESFYDEEIKDGNEEVSPRRWSFRPAQRRKFRDQTPPQQSDPEERSQEQTYDDTEAQPASELQELPQRQRQVVDRNQRVESRYGAQHPFVMPPSQQKQHEEHDGQHDDSLDYHHHLDASRGPKPPGNPPSRRLSKADRMLGVGDERDSPNDTSGGGNRGSFPAGQSGDSAYDDEALGSPQGVSNKNSVMSQGYGGIEAYSEKRGWKRFFSAKRDV